MAHLPVCLAQEIVTPCCRRLRCRADGGGVSGVAAAAGRRAAGAWAAALVSGQVRLEAFHCQDSIALRYAQCTCGVHVQHLLAAGMPHCRSERCGTAWQPSTTRCVVLDFRLFMQCMCALLQQRPVWFPVNISCSQQSADSDASFRYRAWCRQWASATTARSSCGGYTGRELHWTLHGTALCLQTRFVLLFILLLCCASGTYSNKACRCHRRR